MKDITRSRLFMLILTKVILKFELLLSIVLSVTWKWSFNTFAISRIKVLEKYML